MQKNQTIRIGFIGAGSICQTRHLPGLAKIDHVEVVAVCNRSRESAQRVAQTFGIADIHDNWQELVARDDLDAVFIGTWPYMHSEMAQAVLRSGKHCFCQARMCMDLPEAREMLEVAQSHPQLVNMICPPPMRMPFEPWVQRMIREGRLGELTLVELRVADGSNLDMSTLSWREDVRYSGLQMLLMGIFAETLNAWIGPYETLSANLRIPLPTKTLADGTAVEVQVPQVAVISGQLACGALCVEHHTGLATEPVMQLTIHGTTGTMQYSFGDTIRFAKMGEALAPVDVPAQLQRGWTVEQDFVQAVRAAMTGATWRVTPDFAEGMQYMQKVQAVHDSARLGRAMPLESPYL